MSMEPWEAEEEEHYLRLYEEHREQALEEFRAERMSLYFLANPDVARAPVASLDQARALLESSSEAALVLAAAAIEVSIKTLILRPLISGLVHAEAVAPLLADELLKPTGFERSKPLLFELLRRVATVNLDDYRRAGAGMLFWEELRTIGTRRNAVVHRCERVLPEDASHAILLADELLSVIYPTLLKTLNLHLHDRTRVCAEFHLPPDLQSSLDGA